MRRSGSGYLAGVMVLASLFMPARAAAQNSDTSQTPADPTVETILIGTSAGLSAINAFYLTRSKGSSWAGPLGMIAGVASILYAGGTSENSDFTVAVGIVSVVFGGLSLYQADKSKRRPSESVLIRPVVRAIRQGRIVPGLQAELRF